MRITFSLSTPVGFVGVASEVEALTEVAAKSADTSATDVPADAATGIAPLNVGVEINDAIKVSSKSKFSRINSSGRPSPRK